MDLVRVSEIPREILGPSSSRQRYRELGYYSDYLATLLFGVWAEFQRQAGIGPSLHTRAVERNISKTARAQLLANYADQHVKPWDGAYDKLPRRGKRIRLVIGSDFHSYYCNPFGLRVWYDVIKMAQPHGIRWNGDLVDFPHLSTHRHMPGHFPLSVQDEIDWAVSVMDQSSRMAPKADKKFLIGNHDYRLATALADKSPVFASLRSHSFAEQFRLDDLGVGLVARSTFLAPSDRHRKKDIAQNWEHVANTFTIVHGFLTGEQAPRKHLRKFMTHGTNGHLHDRQLVSAGSYETGVKHWWQTPCMAVPQAVAREYIVGPVDAQAWSCGFLVVDIFPEQRHVHGEFVEIGEEIAVWRDQVWKIKQSERDKIRELIEV